MTNEFIPIEVIQINDNEINEVVTICDHLEDPENI